MNVGRRFFLQDYGIRYPTFSHEQPLTNDMLDDIDQKLYSVNDSEIYSPGGFTPLSNTSLSIEGLPFQVKEIYTAGAYGLAFTVVYEEKRYVVKRFLPFGDFTSHSILKEYLIQCILYDRTSVSAYAGITDGPYCMRPYMLGKSHRGFYYMLMEAASETIGTYLNRNPLHFLKDLHLLSKWLETLVFQYEFIHMDLKPNNILLDTSSHLRIIDFGRSRLRLKPNLTIEQLVSTEYNNQYWQDFMFFLNAIRLNYPTIKAAGTNSAWIDYFLQGTDKKFEKYPNGATQAARTEFWGSLYDELTKQITPPPPYLTPTHINGELTRKSVDYPSESASIAPPNPFSIHNLIVALEDKDSESVVDYLVNFARREKGSLAIRYADKKTPLHMACQYANSKVVNLLIDEYKHPFDPVDDRGLVPLVYAIVYGKTPSFSLDLLKKSGKESWYNIFRDKEGTTLLHYACLAPESSSLELIDYFLKIYSVNTLNKKNETPLVFAARKGNLQAVKKLLKAGGASPFALFGLEFTSDGIGSLLEEEERARKISDLAEIQRLLPPYTTLHKLLKSPEGSEKLEKYMDTLLETTQLKLDSKNEDGNTLLMYLVEKGDIDLVMYLLKKKVDINAQQKNGFTALHLAAFQNKLEIAKLLLQYGANPLQLDKQRKLPFEYAKSDAMRDVLAFPGMKKAVEMEWDPDEEQEKLEDEKSVWYFMKFLPYGEKLLNTSNLLHLATENPGPVFNYLLSLPSVNVNVKIYDNKTPLHIAAFTGNLDRVQKLVERGADINAQTDGGVSPLHFAIRKSKKGSLEIMRFLLAHGANPNAYQRFMGTPLHTAAHEDSGEAIRLLLSYKADPSARDGYNGDTPLLVAARHSNPDAFKALRDHSDRRERSSGDKTVGQIAKEQYDRSQSEPARQILELLLADQGGGGEQEEEITPPVSFQTTVEFLTSLYPGLLASAMIGRNAMLLPTQLLSTETSLLGGRRRSQKKWSKTKRANRISKRHTRYRKQRAGALEQQQAMMLAEVGPVFEYDLPGEYSLSFFTASSVEFLFDWIRFDVLSSSSQSQLLALFVDLAFVSCRDPEVLSALTGATTLKEFQAIAKASRLREETLLETVSSRFGDRFVFVKNPVQLVQAYLNEPNRRLSLALLRHLLFLDERTSPESISTFIATYSSAPTVMRSELVDYAHYNAFTI